METNASQAVGENILYQEEPGFSPEMLSVKDDLVSVPSVLMTDRRIKVGDNSYSLQEVVETRLTTELKRMHGATWIKTKAAWLLFWITIGGAYFGLFDHHYLLLLLLLAPVAGLFAYHTGKTDEIQQVWVGHLVLVGGRRPTKLFVGAWYQQTKLDAVAMTMVGAEMRNRKDYEMLMEGWQQSFVKGARRADAIAEAVGAAIAQRGAIKTS